MIPVEKREYHRKKKRESYYRHHETNKAHMRERMRRIKAGLVEMKGGKCVDCGFTGNPVCFHFDHRDPWEKVSGIQALCSMKRSEDLVLELRKCDLVCANCHAIRTSESVEVHKKQVTGRMEGAEPLPNVPKKTGRGRQKKTYW